MLKVKVLGTLVLLGTLASTSTAIAGGKPVFEFPSANQCIHLTNTGRLTFAVIANTGWDKCREAYRRASVEVTITGNVLNKKTWQYQNVNTRELLRPGKVVRPRLNSVYSGVSGNQLNPKDYSLDGSFSTNARWVR